MKKYRARKTFALLFSGILLATFIYFNEDFQKPIITEDPNISQNYQEAKNDLERLEVKGRAPKTNYSRDQFGKGWQKDKSGCDTRNKILKRDLKNTTENQKCQILTGVLDDPYTGAQINFSRKDNASGIQIDHVVALSDAWQKGAQQISAEKRVELANDSLNLLAVEGKANQQKSDGDAATWLPSNKSFRCQYVKRQIDVKSKYSLWVTQAEKTAMNGILNSCTN